MTDLTLRNYMAYQDRIAALEAELNKRRREAQEYEGMVGSLREELAECRREKAELAEKYVGDLGQEVLRLGRELAECNAKLAELPKHPPEQRSP